MELEFGIGIWNWNSKLESGIGIRNWSSSRSPQVRVLCPQVRVLKSESSSRSPQVGVLKSESSSRSPQVGVLKLESSSRNPQVLSQSPSFSLKNSVLLILFSHHKINKPNQLHASPIKTNQPPNTEKTPAETITLVSGQGNTN